MTARPLAGVRILDFCWVGAGPFTTKFLADQGADVIKVESAHKLDGLRLTPPFAGGQPGTNRSGYFADRNTNKRSLCLNMETEEARAIARRLVAASDVVANSFTPGVMDRFGLQYSEVQKINPRAIYLTMSMHGQQGPERNYLGYGMMINALTGLHHLTAFPGDVPVGIGTNYPDHVPNPGHGAFALLAALRYQRKTGKGQLIDIAQTEPVIALLGPEILEYTVNGQEPEPIGDSDRTYCPHGVYRCEGDDRWIAVCVATDTEWRSFCEVLHIENHPGWDSADGRQRNRDEIDDRVSAATRRWDAAELQRVLQGAGVAAGAVADIAYAVDSDPQLAHRSHWVHLPHTEMGMSLYNAPPYRFSSIPVDYEHGAPLLGEHTAAVCREVLGMSDAEIGRLVDSGVLS